MEKVVLQFELEIKEIYRVIRAYLTRKRTYWIAVGVYGACIFAIFVLMILGVLGGGLQALKAGIIFFGPIIILFVILATLPLISGWITIMSAAKKEHLVLPTKYEIDNEKILVENSLSAAKYSWSVFDSAVENEQYFFLTHSSNRYMFQFIPKRAFSSLEDETFVRSLMTEKLGKMENTNIGITGWKLSLLVAFLLSLLLSCLGGGYVLYTYFIDRATPSSFIF